MTADLDYSRIGRAMHIRQPVAITCYVLDLYKQTTKSPSEPPFLRFLLFPAANMTLPFSFGRIRNWEAGGWDLGTTHWSGTGRRSCSLTWATMPPWSSGVARWSTQGPMGSTLQPKWAPAISPTMALAKLATFETSRLLIATTASATFKTSRSWLKIPIVIIS